MMPHKKNPYLLEIIKGKAARMSGYYISCFSCMSKTPFSNSVEVGTMALLDFDKACDEFCEAIELLMILIEDFKILDHYVNKILLQTGCIATYLAEQLAYNQQMSFREAHHFIGQVIRECIEQDKSTVKELNAIMKDKMDKVPNIADIVDAMKYGHGPGKDSMDNAIIMAHKRLLNAKFRNCDQAIVSPLQFSD